MKTAPRGNGFLVAAAAWALLITAVSHVPGAALHGLGFDIWDKAAHAGEFLPLGLLLALFALRRFGERARPALVVAAVAVLGLVLGGLDEIHQSFVPGRSSTWTDAVADGIGSLLGALLAVMIGRRWPHAGSRV